jgi:hypothetical protein
MFSTFRSSPISRTLAVTASVVATALLTATGAPAQAAAQPALTLPTVPLQVGCPWIPEAIGAGDQNSGYPDKNGTYSMAALPSYPAASSVLIIKGQYPQVRYFSFQIADRDENTPPDDQIADWNLIPDEGGTLETNPAQLPPSNGYTDHYMITVRFENVPAVREPNTLYAGVPTDPNQIKQLLMRNYLGNPGTDKFGNTPLPSLTLVTPTGTFDLNNTPDARACAAYKTSWTQTQAVFIPLGAPRKLIFFPSTGGGLVLYPNGDTHYIGALIKQTVGDMIVLRSKAPSYPPVPPLVVSDPNVRYWSVCQNEEQTTASVACIADRDIVQGSDGYFTVVVSTPAKQPAAATPANGYNWITWGDSFDALLVLRQILPSPTFPGNYQFAIDNPSAPLSETIGEWAPDITYCDEATFAANAASGSVAVMAACHEASNSVKRGKSKPASPH